MLLQAGSTKTWSRQHHFPSKLILMVAAISRQVKAVLVNCRDLIRPTKDMFCQVLENIGAPGAIRTPDPQIRSLVLYPAELRVHLPPIRQRPEMPAGAARAVRQGAYVVAWPGKSKPPIAGALRALSAL